MYKITAFLYIFSEDSKGDSMPPEGLDDPETVHSFHRVMTLKKRHGKCGSYRYDDGSFYIGDFDENGVRFVYFVWASSFYLLNNFEGLLCLLTVRIIIATNFESLKDGRVNDLRNIIHSNQFNLVLKRGRNCDIATLR